MRASLLVALAATALAAAPVSAQMIERPVRFGITGGLTFPTGDFGDVVNNGWHANALVEFRPPAFPVGLRGEIGYHSLDSDEIDGGELGTLSIETRIIPVTANAVINVTPAMSPLKLYLLGGVGAYRITIEGNSSEFGSESDSQTEFGLNGGLGVAIPLGPTIDVLVEARYHTVFTEESNTNLIPVSIGFRF